MHAWEMQGNTHNELVRAQHTKVPRERDARARQRMRALFLRPDRVRRRRGADLLAPVGGSSFYQAENNKSHPQQKVP